MPNHYTTVAICSPGYDFDCEDFNAKHADSNLCDIVKPKPERTQEIHSGFVTLPDGTTARNWTEQEVDGEVIHTPTDELSSIDWAIEHWGTKWGTYDVQAFPLGGDGAPVAIKFQSAWSPPSCLDEIAEWLKRVGKFNRVVFIGFDPYDHSTTMLGKDSDANLT
jgi:hypothetical protein